jgi:hypothetical protein
MHLARLDRQVEAFEGAGPAERLDKPDTEIAIAMIRNLHWFQKS